jgi:peptide chain release factor 1
MNLSEEKLKEYLDNPRTKFQAMEYERLLGLKKEAEELLVDEEMREIAEEDIRDLEKQMSDVLAQIEEIIEKEKEEEKFPNEMILEVRAGAGGDEASLFAYELAEMYQRYAESQGWS